MITPYFIAHFKDQRVQGNLLGSKDSLWSSLPQKSILALEYVMPYGDSVVLCGYSEYLHMIEAVQQVGHGPQIEYVYLMGARNNLVVSYRLTILQRRQHDRFKIGDVTVRVTPRGKEYRGRATGGWRKGIDV